MSAHTETHKITFERNMDRAQQPKSYANKVEALIDGINTQTRKQQGWSFVDDPEGYRECEPTTEARRYRWDMTVSYANATRKPAATEFASIVFTLYGRAIKPAGGGSWTVVEVDGKPYSPPSEADQVGLKLDAEEIGYADCEMPADWDSHFEHLYGLDHHIGRVRKAVQAGIDSGWKNRFNTVLSGPPGCGKSDIALSMKAALGEDAVLSFDATSTTAAGLIKTLRDLEILPRVIIFEEIEKANADALLPMLGIADQRGEIRKTTARDDIQKSVKALCIATVNDYDLFCRMMGGKDVKKPGALASRYSNKVFFKRPDREVAMRILKREIRKVDGDAAWAEKAYDYCEQNEIHDVREMISICLCGGDDLLTGAYQKMLDETGTPEEF
jgi:hypothetical protein